jgi:hypothetical protein
MGIRLEHSARRYQAPELATPASRLDLARGELLGRVRYTLGDEQLPLIRDVGDPIAALARRYEDLRFELVARKLEGEPLSPDESSILDAINTALLESMPKPTPEPERVRLALEEAELLLARRRHG